MKRNLKIFLLAILTSSGLWMKSNSQVPPNQDNNWVLNTAQSDEFNGNSLNSSKWSAFYCLEGCHGEGFMHPTHVTFSGNSMDLKVDSLDNPYTSEHLTQLWSAGIQSGTSAFSYGYLEIGAKLPGFYNNGQPCGQGFMPVFWTYYQEYVDNCWIVLDEMDILEPNGSQYADARTNVFGWHAEIGNCNRDKTGEYYHSGLPVLFNDYHKYAVEWLPQRIIYYFDDVPFYSSFNDNSVPDHSQRVLIALQLGNGAWLQPNTPLPQYMSIDYFRYYTLKNSFCGIDVSIQDNTQLNSFVSGVRRNIIIGTGSSSISLTAGDNKIFRATNEITVNGDFTVPLGAELNLIPTPCN